MKAIILEGVATSGKSTITDKLVRALPSRLRVSIKDEAVTHIPIMQKTKDTNLEFFKDLLIDTLKQQQDVVIFDRLYITQAFRSQSKLSAYAQIETMLVPLNPLTIFLEVDEQALATRVEKATTHRDPAWTEYVHTKGETMDEIANYYITQQRSQLDLLKQSKLPYKIFNTTNHDYDSVISYLITFLQS